MQVAMMAPTIAPSTENSFPTVAASARWTRSIQVPAAGGQGEESRYGEKTRRAGYLQPRAHIAA